MPIATKKKSGRPRAADPSTGRQVSLPESLWQWIDRQPGGRSETIRSAIEAAQLAAAHPFNRRP